MAMTMAVLNIVILMRLLTSEKTKQVSEPVKGQEVSVMGKTRTRFSLPNAQNGKPVSSPNPKTSVEPTEEPEDGSPEIGEEFNPEIDEVDEEEVEMEDLFSVTKDDIRLQGNELVADEIARLQKITIQEDISTEEKTEIQSTVTKLSGSEFLRLLKENEEKAEKRNRELLRMIEAEERGYDMTSDKEVESSSDDISLEEFL